LNLAPSTWYLIIMCLIVLAYHYHPHYPLIVAANRDEFYERPTNPAHTWEECPRILAGRDKKYGGTWLGITINSRFAAVTNYRETGSNREHALSRGLMVRDYLLSNLPPRRFLAGIVEDKDRYNGFNLILGDPGGLYYYSNRKNGPEEIKPGIHTLSNHLLDTQWPKSVRSRESFTKVIESSRNIDHESLMKILFDRKTADDDQLPDTGFGKQWERILSPVFIASDTYGTRNSTVVQVDNLGHVTFAERSFDYYDDPGREVVHEFDLFEEI
jgi:uncharacterized protein with NRDE domain